MVFVENIVHHITIRQPSIVSHTSHRVCIEELMFDIQFFYLASTSIKKN